MFEANATVTIRRAGAESGGDAADAEFTTPALVIESEELGSGDRPAVRLRRELLIPPPGTPRAGDLAVYGSETWEIRSVRLCRGVDGRVVAARCAVDDRKEARNV